MKPVYLLNVIILFCYHKLIICLSNKNNITFIDINYKKTLENNFINQ